MSRLTPLILFSVLWLLSCGGESSAERAAREAAERQSVHNPDSIRRVYAQRLSEWDSTATVVIRETGRLYPVDEAPRDTAFFLFRADLLDAIAKQDVFALLDRVDGDIKVSFGGEEGVAAFVEAWELDSKTKTSGVWAVLEKVLRLGGTFANNGRAFYAPYVYSTWPETEAYDAFTHVAITGSGVRVRESPATGSRILETISYEIAEMLDGAEEPVYTTLGGETYPWVKVRTAKGSEGYVYGKYVYSPIDFRAGFEKDEKGRWKMVFLVAGD